MVAHMRDDIKRDGNRLQWMLIALPSPAVHSQPIEEAIKLKT